MQIFKVLIHVASQQHTIDGLEYEGKLWLVLAWLDSPLEQATKPAVMIRFDSLPHSRIQDGKHLFEVHQAISPGALELRSLEEYETLVGTQIPFGIRREFVRH